MSREMKANELRIGNFVNCYVKGITDRFDTVQLNIHHLTDICKQIKDYKYEPIPLTEEWFLKFGFRGNERQRVKRFVGLELYTKDLWRYNTKGNNALVVEYVHQLQNLYFALTGEELTLKERQDA